MNLGEQSGIFGAQVVANMFETPKPQEAGGFCDMNFYCSIFGCGYDGVTFGCTDFVCDYRYSCLEEHSCGWGFDCVNNYYYYGSC